MMMMCSFKKNGIFGRAFHCEGGVEEKIAPAKALF